MKPLKTTCSKCGCDLTEANISASSYCCKKCITAYNTMKQRERRAKIIALIQEKEKLGKVEHTEEQTIKEDINNSKEREG